MSINVTIAACFLLSLLANAGALFLLHRHPLNSGLRQLAGFCLLLSFLLYGFWLVAFYFTGTGINAAVIYHLDLNLFHAGIFEYRLLLFYSILYILICTGLYIHLLVRKHNTSTITDNRVAGPVFTAITIGLIANPASVDLYTLQAKRAHYTQKQVDFSGIYRIPQAGKFAADGRPYNFIYIYLESMERSYFDHTLFPGLTENLGRIESRSQSYTNLVQYPLTGWTIAGMVASQCGLPLLTSSAGNSLGGIDYFLPGATCLGDALAHAGYNLGYLGGAQLEFSGKGSFYQTHGFSTVEGYDQLSPLLDDKNYHTDWGLFDDSLFVIAEQRLAELSRGGQPFGLFLLTLDTHHGDGHPSASCDGIQYGNGKNPILNAVKCTDTLTSRFIENIRATDYGSNTLIIVASDHLAMRNSASAILNKTERRNLFFINYPQENHAEKNMRAGSILDTGATVLDVLGFESPATGFGRSLLGDEKTVVELGLDGDYLQAFHKEIAAFWNYPSLTDGLRIRHDSNNIILGTRQITAPVLFLLDRDGAVVDMVLARDEEHLLKKVYNDKKQSFLLIDYCTKLQNHTKNKSNTDNKLLCVVAGNSASSNIYRQMVENDLFLTQEEIIALLNPGN